MTRALAGYFFLALALLVLGVKPSLGADPPKQKVLIQLLVVETSAKTLDQLGLGGEFKSGKPLPVDSRNSRFLANPENWETVVDVLSRLGLAHVSAVPTLITVSGREASIQTDGLEWPDARNGKRNASQITVKWTVTPTILEGEKVRLDYRFRRAETDLTANFENRKERVREVFSGVEVPFFKPTMLGMFGHVEEKAAEANEASKEKPQAEAERMVTALFVTARRWPPKPREAAVAPEAREPAKYSTSPKKDAEQRQADFERLRSTRLNVLILEGSAKKLTSHLKSTQQPAEALLEFMKERRRAYSVAAVKPDNHEVLRELIRPLQDEKVVNVLSAPQMITLNNHEASCQVGRDVPVRNPETSGKAVEYKRCGIEFHCVPERLTDQTVRLKSSARRTSLDEAAPKVGADAKSGLKTVEAKTVDEVEYGELLVIGPLLSGGKLADGSIAADGDLATFVVLIAEPVNPLQPATAPRVSERSHERLFMPYFPEARQEAAPRVSDRPREAAAQPQRQGTVK